MGFLFAYIIAKRLLFESDRHYSILVYHISLITLFFVAMKIYSTSALATRLTPFVIAMISFYAHTNQLFYLKDVPLETPSSK